MGILDDFKKLFWAKKAVAKSTARKVGGEAKEFTEDSFERIKDFGGKVADTAEDVFDDAKDFAQDVIDDVWKKEEKKTDPSSVTGATSGMGATGSSTNPDQTSTSGASEKKDKVIDKAVEMSDKAWEKAEELARKARETAKNVGKKIDEKVDDMLEKAKELDKKIEEERDAIDQNRDGFADKPLNEKLREQGSLLKDKDDFWSKADQYGKGDYSMGKPVVVGKDDPAYDEKLDLKPISEIKKEGEDLIDDAEIVDDTGPKKDDEGDNDEPDKDSTDDDNR